MVNEASGRALLAIVEASPTGRVLQALLELLKSRNATARARVAEAMVAR